MVFSTPDLADSAPDARAVLHPWQDYGAVTCFSGVAVTVKCFEDNSLVKELVQQPGNGRVIVVDGGCSLRRALLGDQLAAKAVENGWSGLVIAGAVRDVEILETLELGIKALGSCPQKTDKRGEGQLNVSIEVGGTTVCSGDYIYADRNGVLVSAEPLLPL
ncbi:ribonuclease E activity regulator RraA [Congregibacter variabilis]|uniref:4-hydroxy-4-methyl-2-oxoglutarate aldolase n=1 Tax=Congregibacter variabilis TaxID=3081200 RepID=A0ABZ0I6P8_9GAMM|nr:ribonuclease E activity regulator RraA [Congregibacter sp. IMCC43200]